MLYEVERLFSREEMEKAKKEESKLKELFVPENFRDERTFKLLIMFVGSSCKKFYAYYFNPKLKEKLFRDAIEKSEFSVLSEIDSEKLELISNKEEISSRSLGASFGLWLYLFDEKNACRLAFEDEGDKFILRLSNDEINKLSKYLKNNGYDSDVSRWAQ